MATTPPELAKDARNLLASKVLPQILKKVEENAIAAWRISKTVDEREQLWIRVQAIQLIKGEIDGTAKQLVRDGE